MILSHKHKFIFIKTRKTAGTSIEIALSRFCGKDDIITPISPEDEKIRKKIGVKPQNYHESIYDFLPLLIIELIICRGVYLSITYLIDNKTKILFKSIIREIFSKE